MLNNHIISRLVFKNYYCNIIYGIINNYKVSYNLTLTALVIFYIFNPYIVLKPPGGVLEFNKIPQFINIFLFIACKNNKIFFFIRKIPNMRDAVRVNIQNRYFIIYRAINDIIFINLAILRNCRMTPGVLKTLQRLIYHFYKLHSHSNKTSFFSRNI